MSTIADMLIKIGADSSGLKSGLNDAKQAIDKTFDRNPVDAMTSAINGTTTSMSGLIGAVTKYAGLIAGGFGLASMIDDTTKAGTATMTLTKRLNMTAAELGQLKRTLALTGGDVETASKSIMRLDKSFSSSSEAGGQCRAVLEAFGVSLTDSTGKLLPVNKQLEQMAAGYDKALKAGVGQEFLMNTLGARGLALADTLARYNEAAEKAAQVKSIGLKAEELAELDMQIKVLQMQAGQIGTAFTQALLPVAQTVLPALLEPLQEAAVFLKENREELAQMTTTVVGTVAAYKALALAQSAYAAVQRAIATEAVAVETTQQAQLSTFQQRVINARVKAIEAAAMKEIAAYQKTVNAMAVDEAEKLRIFQEFSLQRTIRAQEESLAMRAALTEEMLAYNAAQAEKIAAEKAAGVAATEAAAQKVAAERATTGATVVTTEALAAQTGAHVATGAAAEGAGAKTLLMAGKVGPAVKGLTSLVFGLMGGWLGVAAAIGYATYKFVAWQKELAEERKANTYTDEGSGGSYVYRDGKYYTTGYNPTGAALADEDIIRGLDYQRDEREMARENDRLAKEAESKQKAEADAAKYLELFKNQTEGATKGLKKTKEAAEKLTEYVSSHAIGLDVASIAESGYRNGEQWMGDVSANPTIQCDSWTGDVYAKAGIDSIGGQSTAGLIRDDAFKAAGAYHSASSGYVPQPGDLVDYAGHVGIYLGNGMVRSRQSSGGVNTISLAESESYFGPVRGFGSIAEATNNRQSTQKLTGTAAQAAANRQAEEAIRKTEQAQRDATALLSNIQRSMADLNATDYEKQISQLNAEYDQRKRQITQYESAGADSALIERLRQTAAAYYDAAAQEAVKKQRRALSEYQQQAALTYAQATNDFEAQAQARYEIAISTAQREFEDKRKTIGQSADDVEALEAAQKKYYADVEAAEKELRKNRRAAHTEYINFLKEEGDLAAIIADAQNNPEAWSEDSRVKGMKSLSEQYAVWAANIHMSFEEEIASVSSAAYDSMADGLQGFIMGTKSASEAFGNFANSVLGAMAKIAAQRLASQWMSGLFGGLFGGFGGAGAGAGFGGATSSWLQSSMPISLHYASGGLISGPGTETSDSIPAMLSNGEFVVNAAATKQYRGFLEAINGYANGGYVSAPRMSTPSFSAVPGYDSTNAGSVSLQVNLKNESGSELQADKGETQWDGEKWVVGVVLRAVSTNQNGIRSLIKGVATS